jgi:TIR domain/FHA domain
MDKHVFISYNRNDSDIDFVLNLQQFVEKANFKTWIDSKQLHGGELWKFEIDEAIRNAFALIVIMTPEAKEAEYVTYEWAFAIGAKVPVIPVIFRETKLHPCLGLLHALNFTPPPSNRPWDDLKYAITCNYPNPSRESKEQWQAEADQHIEGLRTQFQEARQKIAELETQLRKAEEQAETGRNDITKLEAQLQEALREIKELVTRLNEGQVDLRNIEKAQLEMKQLEARLREVQDQTEVDQLNIKKLETQLRKAEEQAETYNKELALASAPIICPRCGVSNRPGAKFCWQNGHPLKSSSFPPARLIVEGSSQVFYLRSKDHFVIGRLNPSRDISPDIDLTPFNGEEGGVSHRHARIFVQNSQYMLEDENSTNCTFLNSQQLAPKKPTPLNHNAQIRIGRVRLRFLIDE